MHRERQTGAEYESPNRVRKVFTEGGKQSCMWIRNRSGMRRATTWRRGDSGGRILVTPRKTDKMSKYIKIETNFLTVGEGSSKYEKGEMLYLDWN